MFLAQFLLLIGVDGFRSDFLERHKAPRLAEFARAGVSASALIPCFPSTTFPNFYSIATGLRPEEHGVLEMDFHDPATGKRFYYRDADSVADPMWWKGTPIWIAAENAGLRTAAYFWPGTDVAIGGRRPTWFFPYNPRTRRDQKVRQVLEWLRLPVGERPRLVTVYFSDVDSAAHRFGPNAAETAKAAAEVDASIGELLDGLKSVRPEVNVVIVSDHGQSRVERSIDLTPLADFSGFKVSNGLSITQLYSNDAALVDRTYQALKNKSPDWTVYRRAEIPKHLRYSANPRIGDLVILPNGPYMIGVRDPIPDLRGMHGYDPSRFPEMHGILFAAGPGFRPGARTGAVENTLLYAMFERLLGLRATKPLDPRLQRLLR